VACERLAASWPAVIGHERELAARLWAGLAAVPGLTELRLFDDDGDRTATVGFVVDGIEPGWLAAVLSAEYGIGVRDGAFCAHIATERLIGHTGSGGQAALRVSLGLGSTAEHVDRLVSALRRIVATGARWTYARPDGRWVPVPDPRPVPAFLAG
jgi:selenocysteine lyase/cysteine desulfurase